MGQGLKTSAWDGGNLSVASMFVVGGKDPMTGSVSYVFDGLDPTTERSLLVWTDGFLRQYAYSPHWVGVFGTPSQHMLAKPMSIIAVYNGASSFVLCNSNSVDGGSDPGPNKPLPGFTIGNYSGKNYPLNGYLFEFAVYSRALSPAEITALNAYAVQRYGVIIQ
jgi:hypothetical protein